MMLKTAFSCALALTAMGTHAQCLVELQRFAYNGQIENYSVPAAWPALVWIEAAGAEGGRHSRSAVPPGLGARMGGLFSLASGTALKVLVGQQPPGQTSGGGGGSFLTLGDNSPVLIAGGGGGSGLNAPNPDSMGQVGNSGGSGGSSGGAGGTGGGGGGVGARAPQAGSGGGLHGNGQSIGPGGGLAFVNGGAGGSAGPSATPGGFGGGGAGFNHQGGGGGGGFSGGGSGRFAGVPDPGRGVAGGGGGSFNNGQFQRNEAGVQSGNGYVRVCTPQPVVVVSAPTLTTTEAGASASLTVQLLFAPTADVSVALVNTDASEGALSTASLAFTSANWNQPQTVTVTGVDDALVDGDVAYDLQLVVASSDVRFGSMPIDPVRVTNLDDDRPSVDVIVRPGGLVTTEAGGTDSFTMRLNSPPTADVEIVVSSSNSAEGTVVAPSRRVFTAANWNVAQTVTVRGVDDPAIDGDVDYQLRLAANSSDVNYNGLVLAPVDATNMDDDDAVVPPAVHPVPAVGGLPLLLLSLLLVVAHGVGVRGRGTRPSP